MPYMKNGIVKPVGQVIPILS